jgi:glutaminyl-peptide cyclotransferase
MTTIRQLFAITFALAFSAGWPASGAASEAVPEFPSELAFRFLTAQCSFGPRVPGTTGHNRCLAYIQQTLRESGGNVELQRFRAKTDGSPDSVTLTNVLARFGPRGEGLLLGAHWDSRPWADQDSTPANRGKPILGANDGASGVAVLLALAAVMKQSPPPIPVQIVFFDGEDQAKEGNESGYLLGSREYVRRLAPPTPQAMILVDLVGGRDLHVCREGYSEQMAGWLNEILFKRANALGLTGFDDRVCYTIFDDHVPFLERGIPAVDLIDMHYPQWHTTGDVPGACSQESLGQCGRLLADFLYGGSLR